MANEAEQQNPWERFAKAPPPKAPAQATPAPTTGMNPWERFSAKPPKTAKVAPATPPGTVSPATTGAMQMRPGGPIIKAGGTPSPEEAYPRLAGGLEKAFGIDPRKMAESYHTGGVAGQYKEAGEEFYDNLRSFGTEYGKLLIKGLTAPPWKGGAEAYLKAGTMAPEAVATPIESGLRKMAHGQFARGGAELAGGVAQLVGGAEGAAKIHEHAGVVDGPLKAAAEVAKQHGPDATTAATTTAHQITQHPVINSILHQRVVEDAYEDTKGIDIGQKVDKAIKVAEGEVDIHVKHLIENIPDKVDAAAESTLIKDTFADVIKTPEKTHPALLQMIKDATPDKKNPVPKMWSWEKTKQFRSSVGRAIGTTVGPQKAVLTRVYLDLGKKLRDPAKKYGLEGDFDHYNELEKKIHSTFQDLIDGVRGNDKGAEVAKALNKDTSYTSRALVSLQKYGLDPKEVLDFMKKSTQIQKLRGKSFGTIFRWAYGNPYGVAAMLSARAAGTPYYGAIAAGAAVGIGATYLTRMSRALRLAPDVLEGILEKEKWPGRKPLGVPTQPPTTPTAPPQLPAPSVGPPGVGTPPQLPAPAPVPTPAPAPTELRPAAAPSKERWYTDKGSIPGEPRAYLDVPGDDLDKAKAAIIEHETPKGTKFEAVDAEGKSLGTFDHMDQAKASAEGKVAKAAPEEHGTGKLARQAKSRERVAKIRAEKGPTAAGGGGQEVSGGGLADAALAAQESKIAQQRAAAPHLDVNQLSIPEMEELVQKDKENWDMLQGLRKEKGFTDQEYLAGLRYLTTNLLEEQARTSRVTKRKSK